MFASELAMATHTVYTKGQKVLQYTYIYTSLTTTTTITTTTTTTTTTTSRRYIVWLARYIPMYTAILYIAITYNRIRAEKLKRQGWGWWLGGSLSRWLRRGIAVARIPRSSFQLPTYSYLPIYIQDIYLVYVYEILYLTKLYHSLSLSFALTLLGMYIYIDMECMRQNIYLQCPTKPEQGFCFLTDMHLYIPIYPICMHVGKRREKFRVALHKATPILH